MSVEQSPAQGGQRRHHVVVPLIVVVGILLVWLIPLMMDAFTIDPTADEVREQAARSVQHTTDRRQLPPIVGETLREGLASTSVAFLVQDERSVALEGVRVFNAATAHRILDQEQATALAVTGKDGRIEINADEIPGESDARTVLFLKRGFTPHTLPKQLKLQAGHEYQVVLSRGLELKVRVETPLSQPVPGARVFMSRTCLPPGAELASLSDTVPGTYARSRIHLAKADANGSLQVTGLTSGLYHLVLDHPGHVILSGLRTPFFKMPHPPLTLQVQEVHASVVAIEGDTVLSRNFDSPWRSIHGEITAKTEAQVKKNLQARFPGTLVCVAVPREASGKPLRVKYEVLLEKTGWINILSTLQPVSKIVKPQVQKVPPSVGGTSRVGHVIIDLVDASGQKIDADRLFLTNRILSAVAGRGDAAGSRAVLRGGCLHQGGWRHGR